MRICKTQKACEARGVPKTTSRGTNSNMTLCVCVSLHVFPALLSFTRIREYSPTVQYISVQQYNRA